MTRCYDTYCSIYILEGCKSDRQLRYAYDYMDFMKEHGVNFDKTDEDRTLFERLQREEGSERAITQPQQTVSLQHVATESPLDVIDCTLSDCKQEPKTTIPQVYNTGETEWYTPPEYIDAATKVMGSITVDPASSDKAQEIVKADMWYTKEDDGLKQEWKGHIWMNPPYSQPLVTQFCDLFVEKFKHGDFFEGCVLVNNATETAFFQNMLQHSTSICLVRGRIPFLDAEGNARGAPLQGQIVLYFGPNWVSFESVFSKFGVILHAKR